MDPKETLFETLQAYAASDMLPMHMPGHKRAPLAPYLRELGARLDLTEIDGTDNLHRPEGILKAAQERAAALWGAAETFFLVNGSTCGVLAALYASARRGDEVLLARGSHSSVFHGVELLGLAPRFVLPPVLPELGCFGSLPPEAVEEALKKHPQSKAVVVTSPTYEGVLSDIAGIAEVCRRFGAVLIVDEAHGAHLGFGGFPGGAVKAGADLVVQSLHKTLPSLTQTAVLHRNSDRIDPDRLRHGLGLFQTSSPSYLFLASIDGCAALLKERPQLLEDWHSLAVEFSQKARELTHISLPLETVQERSPQLIFDRDPSKLLLSLSGVSGHELADLLRREHHIETEMAAPRYVLAMTGPGDNAGAFARLFESLRQIDAAPPRGGEVSPPLPCWNAPELAVTPGRALDLPRRFVPAKEAAGKVAAEYVWAYPPGIPLVIPGEVVSEEAAKALADPCSRLQSTCGRLPGEMAVLENLPKRDFPT